MNGQTGAVTLGRADIGLGNVDNTSDANKPVSTAQQTALNAKAPLASPAFTGTPTGITKSHVGLANVDNTADSAKPVSTAQQAALNLKAPLASPAFTGTLTGITKTHVGLGNVDNTADSAKPVSAAQQAALNAKAPLDSPAFTGTPTGITKGHVGLGNVDNTSDANKPVSTATQAAINNLTLDNLVRAKKQGYQPAGSDAYYRLATFPIDDGGNFASLIVTGRLGGWTNGNMASWNILLANRSDANNGTTVKAAVSAIGEVTAAIGCCDLVVYAQPDKSAILYVRAPADQYFAFDLAYNSMQATPAFTGVAEAPTGTGVWHLSSAPRIEETYATKSQLDAKIRVRPAPGRGSGRRLVCGSLMALKRWNGTVFVDAPPKIWNGTAFVDPSKVHIWNGAAFVEVWSSGVTPIVNAGLRLTSDWDGVSGAWQEIPPRTRRYTRVRRQPCARAMVS